MLRIMVVGLWALILVGCNQGAPNDTTSGNDSARSDLLALCERYKPYASWTAERRGDHCRCVYDLTMSGLSEDEKHIARFYLFAQLGGEYSNGSLEQKQVTDGMFKASKAIGDAVNRCG